MFSIITPVFNQSTFTRQFLNDMKNSLPHDSEVIIINNGSTDNTNIVLGSWEGKANLVVINNETNLGFAKAVNQGYAKSSYDNIIFLNNDIKTKNNLWYKQILDNLENNYIVGPTAGYVDEQNFNFIYETQKKKDKFNYISGWCLGGTRNTFEKMKADLNNTTGPFIEDFVSYYEDTYMGFQCKRLGINMKLIEVDMVHFGRMTGRTININEIFTSAKAKFTAKILSERTNNQN